MESARKFLALAPKVVSELEWKKAEWLKNASDFLNPTELEEVKKLANAITTIEDWEEFREEFKNGRTKLEYLKR